MEGLRVTVTSRVPCGVCLYAGGLGSFALSGFFTGIVFR